MNHAATWPTLLFLGSTAAWAIDTADVVFSGESSEDEFGWSEAVAGDVNRDGFLDILVGGPANDAVDDFAGRVYLFRGPFSADRSASSADARFSAEGFGDNLGVAVGGGDIDGDGFSDVVLGARGNDGAGIQAGRVYVFNGPVSGSHEVRDADVVISGDEFDELGWRVLVTDFNGDGLADLLLGAPDANGAGSFSGEAALYYGPLSGDLAIADADARFLGVLPSEEIGEALGAGDLNGDGVQDVILGGPRFPLGGTDTGRTYVFFSPNAGVAAVNSADVVLLGQGQNDAFGASVHSGHDLDNDGADDLLVGADQEFLSGGTGKVYLFHGPLAPGTRSAGTAAAIFLGAHADDEFGQAVAFASGGGPTRVVIGAPVNGAGGAAAGRVYVFQGALSGVVPASAATRTITGDPGARAGHSLSTGNVDGLSGDDLFVGSPEFSTTTPGHVYLYFAEDVVSVGTTGTGPFVSVDIHPNPTRGAADIVFATEMAGRVLIDVLDVGGRRVRRLTDAELPAARHSVSWDARDANGSVVPAGVYLVRISTATQTRNLKLVRVD